jgi:hypothetical protein
VIIEEPAAFDSELTLGLEQMLAAGSVGGGGSDGLAKSKMVFSMLKISCGLTWSTPGGKVTAFCCSVTWP